MSGCKDRCSELLPEYIHGHLEPELGEQVAHHIERCPQCAQEAKVLKHLGDERLPEPDPWFYDSLPGKVTADVEEHSRKKGRFLVPVWTGGLVAIALVLFMFMRPGDVPEQQVQVQDSASLEGTGSNYLSLEDEILPVSGTILDELDRQFVQDLEVLPLQYLVTSDLIPAGDGYEIMDDETIRVFEDLVEELAPVEGRKKVMS